jgi:hypothetical protein
MQSHKCAYLDSCGDRCFGEEWCQYKLIRGINDHYALTVCGKDQILKLQAEGVTL